MLSFIAGFIFFMFLTFFGMIGIVAYKIFRRSYSAFKKECDEEALLPDKEYNAIARSDEALLRDKIFGRRKPKQKKRLKGLDD